MSALLDCKASRGIGPRGLWRPLRGAPREYPTHRDLDFEVHERVFIKRHARQLSGPEKFVLLLAYLAKGQAGKEVQLKDIENHWNKMTAPNLLDGNFNRFYTSCAKENGWVNTKKQGVYILRPQWRDILANE
jgi:hypothetical protein